MRLLIMLAVIFVAAFLTPDLATAQESSCRIGKASYCAKYGGSAICEKVNGAGKAACAKWMQACFTCHEEIPACLGNTRPSADAPICATCRTAWSSCMARIDGRFWPDRMTSRR